MLTSVTSYAVLANAEGLFGVTLMIYRSQVQKSSVIVHNIVLQMTTDDVCACGGQITKVTPNNRLL